MKKLSVLALALSVATLGVPILTHQKGRLVSAFRGTYGTGKELSPLVVSFPTVGDNCTISLPHIYGQRWSSFAAELQEPARHYSIMG